MTHSALFSPQSNLLTYRFLKGFIKVSLKYKRQQHKKDDRLKVGRKKRKKYICLLIAQISQTWWRMPDSRASAFKEARFGPPEDRLQLGWFGFSKIRGEIQWVVIVLHYRLLQLHTCTKHIALK